MIVYEISNWWGIRDLPRIHGSALYKSIVPATLSTALLIVAEWTSSWDGGANQRIIAHPYSVGALIAFFSILLTFHLNYAYTRYWEACTTVHHMVSKWLDCATTLAAFHYQAQAFDDIRPPTYGEHPDLMRKQVAGGPHQRSFCLSYDETMLMIDQHLQVDSAASSVHPNQDTKGVASTTTTMTWWQKLRRKSSSSSSTPEQHSERAARKKNINVSRHDDSEGAVAAKQIPIPLRFQEQFSLATAHHSSRRLQRRSGLVKQSRAFLHLNRQREAKIPKPSLFLQDSAHLFSLLSAVAMATLRNDDPHAEFPLTEYIPGKPWPPVDPDQLSVDVRREYGHHSLLQRLVHFFLGLEHSQMQRTLYNAARPFPVLGGVSDMEIESLGEAVGPSAKVSMASLWLEEFVSREILSGSTGNIPAPLLSNLYQYVSDGLAAFHQARKLSQVPSPFPHTQITAFFSFIIIFLFPVLFYDFATNLAFVSVLNFVTVMCFHGMHEVARVLEEPFIQSPNDLPLVTFQAQFNEALVTMYAGFHPDAWWERVVVDHDVNANVASNGSVVPEDESKLSEEWNSAPEHGCGEEDVDATRASSLVLGLLPNTIHEDEDEGEETGGGVDCTTS